MILFVVRKDRVLQAVRRAAFRLAALAALGVLILVARMTAPPRTALVAAKLQPIYRVTTQHKCLALTFDIGWGEVSPDRVLNVLRDKGVTCTFFVSGPWAAAHPDVMRRIAQDGHEIASHGYWHDNLSQCSKEQIVETLKRAREIITSLVGREVKLFRPPNGDFDDLVILTAMEEGYLTIIWSLDSLDWLNPGVDYMINRLVTRAQPGDIILCHASDSAKETYLALPAVIDGLRAKGLQPIRLSELLAQGGNRYIIQPDRSLIR